MLVCGLNHGTLSYLLLIVIIFTLLKLVIDLSSCYTDVYQTIPINRSKNRTSFNGDDSIPNVGTWSGIAVTPGTTRPPAPLNITVTSEITQPPLNIQNFKDLLNDLLYDNYHSDSYHDESHINVLQNYVSEYPQLHEDPQHHEESQLHEEAQLHEDPPLHEESPLHDLVEVRLRKLPALKSLRIPNSPEVAHWLLNNPNIVFNETISDDLMPDYFDLSADLIPQFERYFNETKSIMDERRQKMQLHCDKVPRSGQYIQERIFYFPELKMAWCPVFKAGSTNWKQFFCKIYKPNVYYEYLNKTDEPYCPIDVLSEHKNSKKHSLVQRKEWIERVKGAVKFLTVRHPYERLVSVYTNKFKNCENNMFIMTPKDRMVKILERYREVKLPLARKAALLEAARLECWKPSKDRIVDKANPYMNPMGATFKEFVEYIVDVKISRMPDLHWASISKECAVCTNHYDVIEKFETLERDHYFLLKILGEELRYPDIAGAHANPSGKSRDKIIEHFSTLNEQLLWKLQLMYKDDFALFEYNPLFRVKNNPYNKS